MGAPQNVIGKLGFKDGGSKIFSYPADIYNTPFVCALRFSEYNREISFKEGTQNPTAAIILPLPSQLAESTNITHSDFSSPYMAGFLQAMQSRKEGESIPAAIARVGKDNAGILGNMAVEGIGVGVSRMSAAAGENLGGITGDLLKSAGGALGTEIATAGKSGAITGMITNPHITSLFSGVALRGYQYSWMFSPRSASESRDLNEIFNYIRRASLPSYSAGKIGLKYPQEVQVDFIGNGIEKFVLGTKRTVITDVSVNYAADGHPAFYKSGAPTSLSLSISLKEVAIRTAEDYGGGDSPLSATGGLAGSSGK
jgi:hypothetical protein